jgi:putative phosphoribosyl transferase
MVFADRVDAGRRLAGVDAIQALPRDDLVVLGLPRGGVIVAAEVARALGVPLDVIVVRKLGAPRQPELAMGAIGEEGVRVLNDEVVRFAATPQQLAAVTQRESAELARRTARLRRNTPRVSLEHKAALIIDDGIATGSTARAACQVARAHGAARVVLATPVAPPQTVRDLEAVADEVIVLDTPPQFYAIGQFYRDFKQTTDEEVERALTLCS